MKAACSYEVNQTTEDNYVSTKIRKSEKHKLKTEKKNRK